MPCVERKPHLMQNFKIQHSEVYLMFSKLRAHIAVGATTITTLLIIGTLIFHLLEDWTLIESFYFTVATLTTVGYGDLVPTHDISRIFAAIYILTGVALAVAALGLIGATYVEIIERRMAEREARREKRLLEKEKLIVVEKPPKKSK